MSDNEQGLSATVIRYTKEVMIGLHDSPLVQKPEEMPSLLTWFGEDPDSPACKNILNGSIVTRTPTDKSIILGPTKTNFASSLYGGLKKTDEGPNMSKAPQSNSSRHNHRQLDERSNNTGIKEYRSPRGPSYMGEKGFSHRTDNSKPSSDRKFMGSSPPPHNNNNNKRYNNNERINDMKNGSSNGRRDYLHNNTGSNNSRPNGRSNNNNHHNSNNSYQDPDAERVPEWMDYTPEVEVEAKDEDIQAQFANDLEAWKSNMKKRDGINEHPVVAKPEKKVEESLEALSIEPKQVDPLSFFEEASSEQQPRREQKGGSRFAKFFAKREEPMTTAVVEAPVQPQESTSAQPRSISLNDLFQGPPQPATAQAASQAAASPTASHFKQQHQHQSPLPHHLQQLQMQQQQQQLHQQQQQQQQQNVRVFSEEDILKSLGAKKANSEPKGNQNEDAMGFNRVLQILSQPKPSLPHNNHSNQDELQGSSPRVNKGSPMMTGSPFDNKPSSSTSSTSSVSNRFGNNLPTSVLRQMSARSSEGRSPSLQSTKSTPPISNTRYSPAAMKQHLPPHIQQQQQPHAQMPNGIPLPPQYFAYQQPPYSPQPPMMDHRAFEQLVQFNNGDMPPPPPRGMPPPPPHLRNGNSSEYLPPHMMMPPLLPPGQRPMMTPPPPPHFNQQQMLHMQQQQGQHRFPLQQQQQQQQQQQSMPPHAMANGMPPQMFAKNQGWERQ
ncbi:hypothetical protein V8B55DRAFT_1478813 [Mucor lusitanicus]|uniref:Uncharacterized protein n=1 Tax=Mucor circinelloides f. lusitanicus TaxID=29924 RepID=A0A8H4BHL1_MUCCL|nr:hypothetical protein FB192DRAFT_1436271 [Mucor lusitanicus]